MKNIFFNDEVLAAEKKIISNLKIPSALLMENAGAGAADFILKIQISEIGQEIIIVSGKGNNAGDGFVIARHLIADPEKKAKVKILTLFRERDLKGDALTNYVILKKISGGNIPIIHCAGGKDILKEINSVNTVLVDAVFGIGFKGDPDARMKSVFESINSLKNTTVISVDCPSGFHSYDQKQVCVKADITLTMGVKKYHSMFYKGREVFGKTELINIGIDPLEFSKFNSKKIYEIEEKDIPGLLAERKINSHKYSNGKVFVLAGSRGLSGAAYLCSLSALRSGAGAVVTGIPESLNDVMEVKLTEVMTLPLDETGKNSLALSSYDKIIEKMKWADSVLIGPGLSNNEETRELVRKIVRENDHNYVLDADAITAFCNDPGILKNKRIIITPHIGEFAKLTGKSIELIKNNFYGIVTDFVKKYKITVVLKNSPTVIADESGFYINSTGSENLATAGSGDVLSGIIAGLLSQTGDRYKAAISGVYIHGKCGDKLYSKSGKDGMVSGDLISEIAEVKNNLRHASEN